MIDVKIGGVPEHFNLAWYLTLKEGAYKAKGINLRWSDYHGGTGQMCEGLRNGDIDLAVILTEGIIKDIIAGNPSKIIQVFVASPLIWGIHVSAKSNLSDIEELRGKKAAISRFGSGSHLMAFVNAHKEGWDTEKDLEFELIRNLDGAIKGLTEGQADYFLWEKFTTKPIVDEGIFKRIGEIPTPWPCFVIAARDEFIKTKAEELKTILEIINNTTADFKYIPSIDRTISSRYGQKLDDVQEWLGMTEWSQNQIKPEIIDDIQSYLLDLDLIPYKAGVDDLLHIQA